MSKIAIVTPVFPPYGGGIGRVAAEDARVLSSAGFDVEVFSPKLKDAKITVSTVCHDRGKLWNENYGKIIYLKPVLKFGNAALVPQLLWKLRGFDAVHLHYPFFGGAEVVWLARKLRLFSGKLVITYHMDVVGSGWLGKIFAFHTKFIMPRILALTDKIIVTSIDYASHSNAARFAKKFIEIPIGVDDEFFHLTEKDVKLAEKLGIRPEEKVILFVGGLDSAHYFKGLGYLISAARKIKNDFKIIVAGSGNLREDYEKMAESLGVKNKIIFAGSPSREDLPKFYNLADVFVLPSIDKSEAFGIVLLEAMASGVPVVASNLFGARTLVTDNGFLAEPKNAEDLAEKINLILGNEYLRKKMGENSRKKAEEKYSYKKVGEKLIDIYKKKKVCLANNLYDANARGGAEKAVETVVGGLKEKGHEVFIISLSPLITFWYGRTKKLSGNAARELREYKIFPLNICLYENLARHGMFFRLVWHVIDVFNLHSFFAIRKILKKERTDIVWTHNLMGLGFTIPLAIKSLKIKHIHTLHDVQLSSPSGLIIKGKEKNIFGRKLYEIICRALFGSPDIVISPSKWLLDFYTEKGFFPKSQKMVLQNPTQKNLPTLREEGRRDVSELYYSKPLTPDKSGELPLSKGSRNGVLNILYLGQVEDHKGIVFVVNALKKLSLNFILHIVGDGEKLEEIKKITAGDARFVIYGRKSGSELEEIWKNINLTIIPSLCYENSPTVIFESLIRGISVIASNIGGIPEILPQEFLFEAGDEREFLEKIKWFSKNGNGAEIKFPIAALSAGDFIDIILREIK